MKQCVERARHTGPSRGSSHKDLSSVYYVPDMLPTAGNARRANAGRFCSHGAFSPVEDLGVN